MKGLFIWTVVSHQATIEGLGHSSSRSNNAALLTLDRHVSREIVELTFSGVCSGTLVRFIQPHGHEMVRLAEHERRLNSVTGQTSTLDANSLILEVKLLGTSKCAATSCGMLDRPCVRYAARDAHSLAFLVCSSAHCLSRERSGAAFVQCAVGQKAQVVPSFIRRLVDLSFSALPDRDRCAQCEAPAHVTSVTQMRSLSMS